MPYADDLLEQAEHLANRDDKKNAELSDYLKTTSRHPHAVDTFVRPQHSLKSCEKNVETPGLTDESVCPTLVRKSSRSCGAGAFACQPIFFTASRGRGSDQKKPA